MKTRSRAMPNKYGSASSYRTPAEGKGRSRFPGLSFYFRLLAGPLLGLYWKAARGKCDDFEWTRHSNWFGDVLESVGCEIDIEGLDVLDEIDGPCVFVANHMSTLETFLLPGIIRPRKPVTFVVKESLVTMPVFGPIMRSRNPVVVRRANPREDLKVVMTEGVERLKNGISMIVFPQHTRSVDFIPANFNTIGEKLAARADVPVVPIALKTDAWGQGSKIKECGKIRPDLPVRARFGEIFPDASDRGIHERICAFIGNTLSEWQAKDGKAQ